jgi:hypothetical protein
MAVNAPEHMVDRDMFLKARPLLDINSIRSSPSMERSMF